MADPATELDNANKPHNTVTEIKKFLSTPENPVTMAEFNEFWKTLSEEEKEDFRTTELPQ